MTHASSPRPPAITRDVLVEWIGGVVDVRGYGRATVQFESDATIWLTPEQPWTDVPLRYAIVELERNVDGVLVAASVALVDRDARGRFRCGPSTPHEAEHARGVAEETVPVRGLLVTGCEPLRFVGATTTVSLAGVAGYVDRIPPVGSTVALSLEVDGTWVHTVARAVGRDAEGVVRLEFVSMSPEVFGTLVTFVSRRTRKAPERTPTTGLPNNSLVPVWLWGAHWAPDPLTAIVSPMGVNVRSAPSAYLPGDHLVIGVEHDDEVRFGAARVVSKAGGLLRTSWS